MLDDLIQDNLEGILESIALIEARLEKVDTAEDFVLSAEGVVLLDSVSMRLQVIGELLKKIDKIDSSFFQKYPYLEWNKIMRLRDIISHHYDVIDHEIIFDICENHVPQLKTTIAKILEGANITE
ncbi:MAG: HepT-like ribonuclease domain-containing protein [Thermodesulfobacteriota bacterium]|nr:HepT-like ribonuclease domain-containing protein [Thermodesulfobacteriota bacterium]